MYQVLFVTLTLVAAFSPLLTFAHLWQVKEWRLDRLRAHFRETGVIRQLFGFVRPLVVAFSFLILPLQLLSSEHIILGTLALLGLLTIVQIVLHKQPRPVMTRKAILVLGLALLLTAIVAALLASSADQTMHTGLLLLPILQPFFVALSLLLLSPLDRMLKNRILEKAARAREAVSDATVIGITGSVGKTTMKELLAHILAEMSPLVTPAYVNTEMGVAQWLTSTLQKPHAKNPLIIAEMGAYRKGEIALLCRILRPRIGIITYIGTQHLALFGSERDLLHAKAELLDALPASGHAFLNGDQDVTKELRTHAQCPVTVVSTGGRSDLEAFDIAETGEGIRFRALETDFRVPLHGTHNVINVLLAIGVARSLGLSLTAIAKRLTSYAPPSHTFAVHTELGVTYLDDTHNSSMASFKAAIAWARTQPFSKKTLLAAGLIELGEIQDRAHAELGSLSQGVFDRVIFLNAKSAVQFQKGYGERVELFSKDIDPVPSDSLLVCIGRMPLSRIQHLIP